MKMTAKAYFILAAQVVAGLVILLLLQQLRLPAVINTILVFYIFLLLNLTYKRVLGLRDALRIYWSPRKIHLFLVGIVAGAALVAVPLAVALFTGAITGNNISIGTITATSVFITFLITGWEELWFRSLLLNHVNKRLPERNISLAMGLLFAVIHLLNPEINMLKNGPVLFMAGTLLTALYFYSRSIWLPAGLHFANNFFGSNISSTVEAHEWFGSEGYIYTGLLLIATVFFLWRLGRRTDMH